MSTVNDTLYGFTLLYTLREHTEEINCIEWSPEGRFLVSSSFDKTICIWDSQTGNMHKKLEEHTEPVYRVVWSPDGQMLASCSKDRRVLIYDAKTYQHIRQLIRHRNNVYDLSWSPGSSFLASCSEDHTICVWDVVDDKPLRILVGHSSGVFCVAWSPQGDQLVSGSAGGPMRLWQKAQNGSWSTSRTLRGHTAATYSIVWSRDGKMMASCSEDHSILLWEAATWRQTNSLVGHTDAVTNISFSHDGQLLASKSRDGTIRIWRTDTWEPVATIKAPASDGIFADIAFHPNAPLLATLGERDKAIFIWKLDIPALLGITPEVPSVRYSNAKVVLVGESSVGKSGLALVLTGQSYAKTDSTHGRYVWNFNSQEEIQSDGRTEIRETLLWDLAGQPAYRLIHQLHLSEVAVALVVFDSHNSTDPFAGISHWVRALHMAQLAQGNTSFPVKKLLVAARIDRGTVRVSRKRIDALVEKWGFDGYYETSALEGQNISVLIEAIKSAIDWDKLPKVTSTDLFQQISAFLMKRGEDGQLLATFYDLYREFMHSRDITIEGQDLRAEFRICIGLIEAQGLIRRLSFGDFILLRPELLDIYASALINAARAEPDELGSIPEEQVKSATSFVPGKDRVAD